VLFASQILGGSPVTGKVVGVTDYGDIRDKVAADPTAVGIDAEGFASGAVRLVETPEVASPIIAVTKGAPSPEVQRLLNFLAEIEAAL
jgi:phosphate transport system substrate-binding protein